MLAPAVDMDRVGMADEQQPLAAARALPLAPDIRTAGQEFGGCACRSIPARCICSSRIGDEVRLVAGDALAPDRAAQERERLFAVERGAQAVGAGR